MAISETITIDADPAIEQLNAVAAAADKAAAAMDKLKAGGASGAGADRLAASMDRAAASIQAAVDKITAAMDRLGKLGSSAAGAADGLKTVGDAGKTAAAGVGSLGDAAAGTGDKLKVLGDAGKGAGDGLKSLGDSAKASEAFLSEYNAVMDETIATSDRMAAAIRANAADIAAAQRLNATQMKAASDEALAAQAQQARAAEQAAAASEAAGRRAHGLLLGGAAALGYGIYEAAKLQTQVTRLYTSAGESKANLPAIQAGILGMAGPTATDQNQLAQGMYWVESAGFHGKTALNVLRAVAQGAYAEGAPLQDVANAATSIMTSYGMRSPSQTQANSVINMMLQAVGHGKMTMAGLSAALPAVLPVAASAGLSLPQVLGSLATMTAPGMSADWASQNLRHTIGSLMNPNTVQTAEMYQLGLDPVKLAQNIGKTGISGTLQEIQAAVRAHENKAGLVQLPAMNISKAASQDALTMLKEMPPAIRAVGQAYFDGKISAAAWNKEMFKGSESGQMKNLLQQFATVTNLAHGFNASLKSGQPDVQAYNAAVSKLMGGTVGMQTYLELTGTHSAVAAANIKSVAQAARDAGTNVAGWNEIQKTFNYQLKSFEVGLKAAATTIGAAVLPVATDLMKGLAGAGNFLAGHKTLTLDVAMGAGLLALPALLAKIAHPFTAGLNMVGKVAQVLHIPGLDKLANLGQGSGLAASATALDGSATALDGAAEALAGAAEKLSVGGGLPGIPGGKGKDAAAAEQAAVTEAEAGGMSAAAAKQFATKLFGRAVAGALIYSAGQAVASQIPGRDKAAKGAVSIAADAGAGATIGSAIPGIGTIAGAIIGAVYGAAANTGQGRQSAYGTQVRSGGLIPAVVAEPLPGSPAAAGPGPPLPVSARMTQIPVAAAGQGLHPVKVPPPDMGAYDAGLNRLKVGATQAVTSAQAAMNKKVRPAPPDLSPYSSAAARAHGLGVQVGAGFASGIMSEQGQVAAAARALASAATSAMGTHLQIHSPSKVTQRQGAETAQGYVAGLEGGQAAVNAAATALAKTAAKAGDIATIDATFAKLIAGVPAGDSGLVKMLRADNAKMVSLAGRRAALEAEIKDAGTIAQQAISGASIMGAGTYTPALAASNGPLSAYATISGMQGMAADQKQFAQVIAQLQKQGLNATSLNQIVQAGAQQGLPVALGLAQGGKGAISQVNQLESQIRASAGKLGDAGAPAMYQAGVQAAQGFAQGLKSQLSAVDAAMAKLAQTAVAAAGGKVKAATASAAKGAVSSAASGAAAATAAAGAGGTSLAAGSVDKAGTMLQHAASVLDRAGTMLEAAASRMLANAGGHGHGHAGGGPHYGTPAAYGGGGVTVHHHYNVTNHIQGSVTAERDLVDAVQSGIVAKGVQNWQTGSRLPYKAS